jgi:hypothetical protein
VPLVVMGHALDIAGAQRQQRLGALQRLHLALLIHAQDQGLVRWLQVEPDHIAQLLDEGIRPQLETFTAVLPRTVAGSDAHWSSAVNFNSVLGRPIGMAASPARKIPKFDAKHMPLISGTGH